jgi:hypothetical protein
MTREQTIKNLERIIEYNIHQHETSPNEYDKRIYSTVIKRLATDYKIVTGNYYRRPTK